MEGRLADKAFHAALLAATAKPFIVSLTNGVTAAVNALTEFKQRIAQRSLLTRRGLPRR